MLYVQQSLAPDEKIIYIAKFHWFYDFQAIMCIVWGLFYAVALIIACQVMVGHLPYNIANAMLSSPLLQGDNAIEVARKLHPMIKLVALFVFIMGLMKFARLMVIKVTTEIVVTNTRIIYKRGLVARNVGEMSLDRIESISVMQSFWGRIFDFGRLIIYGMGVGEIAMPNLADPISFRRAIESVRK